MTAPAGSANGIASPAVIWRISDGRPGHDNQSLGLVEALARRVATDLCEFTVTGRGALRKAWSLLRETHDAPAPWLLVGAGHATHLPLLAARWRRGGHSVVLMKPSLPRALFDVCIVPAHDGLAANRRTLITRGAINRVRPHTEGKLAHGALVLVGGPSREYGWSSEDMQRQLRALLAADDGLRWRLCDSRRTPADTRVALAALGGERVEYVAHDSVAGDWLPRTLAESATVWVSEDSASMVYEALSAQAAVGLLAVPRTRPGRVAGGMDALRAEGLVRGFEEWRRGLPLRAAATALAEADRCADWLVENCLRDAT